LVHDDFSGAEVHTTLAGRPFHMLVREDGDLDASTSYARYSGPPSGLPFR